MLPWLLLAVVVVPLVVIAFAASLRKTKAGEHPANEDAAARARTEAEFEKAEEYQREWREEREHKQHPHDS